MHAYGQLYIEGVAHQVDSFRHERWIPIPVKGDCVPVVDFREGLIRFDLHLGHVWHEISSPWANDAVCEHEPGEERECAESVGVDCYGLVIYWACVCPNGVV